MIIRLQEKHYTDILIFIKETNDKYNDFYITKNKQRIFFLNTNFIKNIIKNQEIYGLFENELVGLFLIYREKGFRPYIKIIGKNYNIEEKLIKFLSWNFSELELFAKVKKYNSLNRLLQKYGFIFTGDRGQEILLIKPKQKAKLIGVKDYGHDNQ